MTEGAPRGPAAPPPECHGRGPLDGRRAEALARRLAALPGVTLAPTLRFRARPGGIGDGFDAGADPDEPRGFDPAAPDLRDLGDELASVEFELTAEGRRWALALTTRRDATGPTWTATLDPLDADAPAPAWWPAVARDPEGAP